MTEDLDVTTFPDFPALKDVAMRDSRDDVFPWQAQQLERLGYEGPRPRDHFEAQEFIDRLKPSKTPELENPNDLTPEQLDAMYVGGAA